MLEFQIQTDRGPMKIAAESQEAAENLARNDGYKIKNEIFEQALIVYDKHMIELNQKMRDAAIITWEVLSKLGKTPVLSSYEIIEVELKDLPKIRRSIGPLRVTKSYYLYDDQIMVELKFVDLKYSHIEIRYKKTLKDSDHCKVVENTVVIQQLVCRK